MSDKINLTKGRKPKKSYINMIKEAIKSDAYNLSDNTSLLYITNYILNVYDVKKNGVFNRALDRGLKRAEQSGILQQVGNNFKLIEKTESIKKKRNKVQNLVESDSKCIIVNEEEERQNKRELSGKWVYNSTSVAKRAEDVRKKEKEFEKELNLLNSSPKNSIFDYLPDLEDLE